MEAIIFNTPEQLAYFYKNLEISGYEDIREANVGPEALERIKGMETMTCNLHEMISFGNQVINIMRDDVLYTFIHCEDALIAGYVSGREREDFEKVLSEYHA